MRQERLLLGSSGKKGYCREDQGRKVIAGKIREERST